MTKETDNKKTRAPSTKTHSNKIKLEEDERQGLKNGYS